MGELGGLTAEERRTAAREFLRTDGGVCHVKLCGMFRDEDVAAANACQPDLVGFVTGFPRSHRNVDPDRLGVLSSQVDGHIFTVAVMVDLPLGRVAYNSRRYVDIVQLHGNEDNTYISGVRMRTNAGIIQAFRIREAADVERANRSAADMVLLDAGQGSGQQFDWSLVQGIRRPFILAGGLTPDNVAEAVRTLQPWGVDLSSGLETNRLKDPGKMAAAVAAVRSAK